MNYIKWTVKLMHQLVSQSKFSIKYILYEISEYIHYIVEQYCPLLLLVRYLRAKTPTINNGINQFIEFL